MLVGRDEESSDPEEESDDCSRREFEDSDVFFFNLRHFLMFGNDDF